MDPNVLIPFWNRKNIQGPELLSTKILSEKPLKVGSEVSKVLSKLITLLESQSILLQEHFNLLDRLVYRMKSVFRNDKGFKTLQMLRKAMGNYDAPSVINIFSTIKNYTYEDRGPSRQMMHWALVSLQRLVGLFYRINTLSMKATSILKERFYNGHHWNVAVICVAVMSKVWTISKHLIVQISNYNEDLYSFIKFHPIVGEEWLPEDHKIEKNLIDWLGNPPTLKKKETVLDLKEKFSIETQAEEVPVSKEGHSLFINEDVGEAIKSTENLFTSVNDFLNFLKTEKQVRSTNRSGARSRNLSRKQWNRFCTEIIEAVSQLKNIKEPADRKEILNNANKLVLDVIK